MTNMQSMLFFLCLIGFAAVVASRARDMARSRDHDLLARIDEEFRAIVVSSEVPNLGFDGRTAEIVDEQQVHSTDEEKDVSRLVSVQRFARNAYGEYFFFISEGEGRPFFKHGSHTNAKIALGKKYVESSPMIDG